VAPLVFALLFGAAPQVTTATAAPAAAVDTRPAPPGPEIDEVPEAWLIWTGAAVVVVLVVAGAIAFAPHGPPEGTLGRLRLP
jgi:hypothetical protein